jgi:hypothetical protein
MEQPIVTIIRWPCVCGQDRATKLRGTTAVYRAPCCGQWWGLSAYTAIPIEAPDGSGIDAAGNPYPPRREHA